MKRQHLVSTLDLLQKELLQEVVKRKITNLSPFPLALFPTSARSLLSVIALLASNAWNSAYGVTFTPPPKNPTPSQASGGGSRGNLFTLSAGKGALQQASGGAPRVGTYYLNASPATAGPAALIALLPQSFYGTTVSERPTILVYLPASNAEEAMFSLKDEAGKMQYQMTIPVIGKHGVIAVKLPAKAPALAVGKNYQWFLALKIDGQLSPSTPYVDGWIQRIQPSGELATAMQHKDALQRATALGKNGVWYDCVATLAAVYTDQPTNAIAKQWEELLSSVSLNEIVKVPLVASAN
ncbi:DUF928 domain-containing protein [Nostocaceae cyanobacterium CENA369]|uniref:DUF928 domain-containing protein n=1 Tax=Dendronalium phyllosphericum CENA369 TaxID=1725256 RepID=A0A8J7IHJ3_9NOST|nr:DUF928 domain-containing protein [Dendronalium phyllosphericum]MBH8576017.1 DUF928 domain-containing protein [Dendronalium phyllosphericum CENA369]